MPEKSHGESNTKLYRVWRSMHTRCDNPNSKSYPRYGGRGITVCDEWKSYESFRDWCDEVGYREGLTIERIDNSKGYSPSNCTLATWSDQARNRRSTVWIQIDEHTKLSLVAACELFGMKYTNTREWMRVNGGMTTKNFFRYRMYLNNKKG